MDAWEAGMAQRAAARRRAAEAAAKAAEDAKWDRWVYESDRQGREWAESMTLGEATDFLRNYRQALWACACIGAPYCCRFRFDQALTLERGAYITAKLLADASAH